MNPLYRAMLACSVFGLFALWSFFSDPGALLPLGLYYAALLLNTFFSVRTFAAITPPSATQNIAFDGALALLYLLLARSFASVPLFCVVSTALFGLAIFKYHHLKGLVGSHYSALLSRKMKMNGLGALLGLAGLAAALEGQDIAAAWGMLTLFALATPYLLFIKPLYRLPAH